MVEKNTLEITYQVVSIYRLPGQEKIQALEKAELKLLAAIHVGYLAIVSLLCTLFYLIFRKLCFWNFQEEKTHGFLEANQNLGREGREEEEAPYVEKPLGESPLTPPEPLMCSTPAASSCSIHWCLGEGTLSEIHSDI